MTNHIQQIVAIIQARTGSSRLPKKVLLPLNHHSVLAEVIERVRASKKVSRVILATSIKKEDLAICNIGVKTSTQVYCGSEDDVLDRYYQAARLLKADQIVRITSDCPLMDPAVIDEVISLHLHTKADYTTNTLPPTYPDGLDVEVFTFAALKKAWQSAQLASEREHVTPFLRNHSRLFKQQNLKLSPDASQLRLTLDHQVDYQFIKKVFSLLPAGRRGYSLSKVLSLLAAHPKLLNINQHITRNEGYLKSLLSDSISSRRHDG